MSLHGVQAAIAALVHVPKHVRVKDVGAVLAQFSLNEMEREALLRLNEEPQIEDYAQEMAEQRWSYVERYVIHLFDFVPLRTLRSLWQRHFEPVALFVESDVEGRAAYSRAFLQFLLEDKKARARLKLRAAPFIFDLIRYELAELELSTPEKLEADVHARFKHGHFRVVRLNYDIPKILLDVKRYAKVRSAATGRRKLVLMLLHGGVGLKPRVFEIEENLAAFLEGGVEGVSAEVQGQLRGLGVL